MNRATKKRSFLKIQKGFTLLEVLFALTIISSALVGVYLSINQATVTQKKAEDLIVAVRLAQQVMETVKSQNEDAAEDFDLPAFPDFSASYSIKEEEYDLAKLASEQSTKIDTATGAIFTLKHYQVVITYANQQKYILDFYKGSGMGASKK